MRYGNTGRRGFVMNATALVVGAVVLVAVGLAIGYSTSRLISSNKNSQSATTTVNANVNATANTNATVAIENANLNTNVAVNVNTSLNANANINANVATSRSSEIQWSEPTVIDSLKLFKSTGEFTRDSSSVYYVVGKFIDGKYKDGELILLSAAYEGPSFYPGHYRFVRQGTKLTILTKYSDAVDEYSDFNTKKFSTDAATTIAALDFPATLKGAGPRQDLIVADSYLRGMFDLNNLKLVFTDTTYGPVYTTDKPTKAEYRSALNSRYGFYLKAPDGTVRVYKLDFDFMGKDSVPAITWNDGSKNAQEFRATSIGGCGAMDFANVVDTYINRTTDLKPVGSTSKGDVVYALKDGNHWILRDLYNTASQTWYDPDIKKLTLEQFAAVNPIVFYVDPFDRLIEMINMKYGPQVECGKPVIYLYPQSKTTIDVRLEPQGGFSFTEPAYRNGWTVEAAPNGELRNLADGKTYPYLFWEGRGGQYASPDQGFVVAKSEVHSFLVASLAKLGLNDKETADFVEFWEPRMQSSPYYVVSFFGKSEMDRLAPLTISPRPDTVIRILMDYRPIASPVTIAPQRLSAPARNGFTVVEWGGVLRGK